MNNILDKNGNNLRTYEDEECIQMMEAILYQDDPYEITPNTFKTYSLNIEYLSDEDKDLLFEYSPKLFNTLPKEKTDIFGNTLNLYFVVSQLVQFVIYYKLSKTGKEKTALAKTKEPLNKQTEHKKEAYLQQHAKAILAMIGGTTNHKGGGDNKTFEIYQLKKHLENLIQSPHNYLPVYPKTNGYFGDKNIIKENLKELKLPLKDPIIEEFIKLLK